MRPKCGLVAVLVGCYARSVVQDLPVRALGACRTGIARLTVEQFHRMIESGILAEGTPVELIEGVLVRKDSSDAGTDPMTHGPKHAFFLQRTARWFSRTLEGTGFHPRQQLPVALPGSEPEPDLALVRGAFEDYRDRHPGAVDCAALIEVADSSLEVDREVKGPLYATAGIATYWILNVRDGVLEVHEAPVAREARWARRTVRRPGDRVVLPLGPAVSLEVDLASLLA